MKQYTKHEMEIIEFDEENIETDPIVESEPYNDEDIGGGTGEI